MTITTPQRPIFIVGPARSGTTLVRSILSAHPNIAVPAETHFLLHALNHGLSAADAPRDFDRFWTAFTQSAQFPDLDLDEADCLRRLEKHGDRSFKAIFDTILVACQEKAGKARVGEKTPDHAAFIGYLLDWYPDARIIFLQRDPRAVAASQLGTPWIKATLVPRSWRSPGVIGSRAELVAFFARYWSDNYELYFAPYEDDPRVMLLRYESLVAHPEEEVRKFCSFIGEEFEPQMVERRDRDSVPDPSKNLGEKYWPDWHRSHYDRSREPIKADALEKWRGQLSKRELMMIEGWCESRMRNAGYAFTCSPPERMFGRLLVLSLIGLAKAEDRAHTLRAPRKRRKPRHFSLVSRRRQQTPARS